MIENLRKFEKIKMEKIANFTFLKKSTFQVFNHISGHIQPTGTYYTSK